MAVSDPVADFLTRIRNAIKAQHRYVDIDWSKMKQNLAEILKNQGFIENYLVKVDESARNNPNILEIYKRTSTCDSRIKKSIKTWFAQICWTSRYSTLLMVTWGFPLFRLLKESCQGMKRSSVESVANCCVWFGKRIEEKTTMSRKGKLPIPLPKGVEVKVSDAEVSVKGPKGSLHQKLVPGIQVKVEDGQVLVSLEEDKCRSRPFSWSYTALSFNNMVIGTTEGFEKKLEMIGVGYRAAVQGDLLDLQLGFSHPTKLPIPKGLTVKVDKNTLIIITGFDKQLVGQFAATVRSKRPPEPYQGKGFAMKANMSAKKRVRLLLRSNH